MFICHGLLFHLIFSVRVRQAFHLIGTKQKKRQHSLDTLTEKLSPRRTLLHGLETFICHFGADLVQNFC